MGRALLFVLAIATAFPLSARNAAEVQLALRKLAVTGSALYVAAQPGDENQALLAWLANERLYRTASLSITRGDAGQNLIGTESGPLLGLIRTQEQLAARQIDGAQQLFTRAIDFGYSKTEEETLQVWGRAEILADVVWAIRRFQPDVIITRFPIAGEGGQAHRAAASLAEGAFTAAADPSRFAEQLEYVDVWQAKRIVWDRLSVAPAVETGAAPAGEALCVDLGAYNALLGRAYAEMGADSRSRHQSQGSASAVQRGTQLNCFEHRGGDPATTDLFDGIDSSWARYPNGAEVGTILQQAAGKFDPDNPSASLPPLLEAYALIDAPRFHDWTHAFISWRDTKRGDLLAVIRDCAGLAIETSAPESTITPGGEMPISVTVLNRSDYPFRLAMVASKHASVRATPDTLLENNKPVTAEIKIKLSSYTQYSQPYWLVHPPERGRYQVAAPTLIGRPGNVPEIPIDVVLMDATMKTLTLSTPLVHRRIDPVEGERVREVDVVPPASVKLSSNVYLFPEAKPRTVTVWMKSFGATEGTLKLLMPKGWKAEPDSSNVKFAEKGDEKRVTFTVTPPAGEETAAFLAELLVGQVSVREGIIDVDYPHIPPKRVLGEAAAKIVRADIKHLGQHLGYIMGSADDVPNILRQVGYEVNLLTDADLDRADFAKYDVIVAGVRAYNTRRPLALAHEKLMEYVEKGGTYVVQYNTPNLLAGSEMTLGPYPFTISTDRVTGEAAPVRILDREHPLLSTPNQITEKDFEGWADERGLHFARDWDSRYTTVLATNDPGEPENAGGQLYVKKGKGTYIYTSYSWWRQVANGVPGAIRAFVNLLSQ
ncbi:MAG: PIG-L family deacetylase [Thermoanaerobaculia bacterium]